MPKTGNASGNLLRNITGAIAQYENELKAERTINGMKEALRSGRWCWQPPWGYKRIIGSDGKSWIAPGNRSADIIHAYQMANEGFPQVEIASKLGISAQLVNRILTNALYCGLIRVPWFSELIEAKHEAVITQEQFFAMQARLRRERAPELHRLLHPDFPLRGFVRCAACTKKLTTGWCKGKRERYAYYFCRTKGCSVSISRTILEQEFFHYLQSFQPSTKIVEAFLDMVRAVHGKRNADIVSQKKSISGKLAAAQQQKSKLDDLIVKGVIDEDTYRERSTKIRAEMATLKLSLHEAQTDQSDIDAALEYCGNFVRNLGKLWADSEADARRRVQTLVFPEDVSFSRENGFRTPRTALIFQHLRNIPHSKIKVGVPKGI